MTRKQRRLTAILGGLGLLAIAATLALNALSDSIVFFYGPSDLAEKHVPVGARVRIGGLVEADSIVKGGDGQVSFAITDGNASVPVIYRGILPDLFAEGEGVVAEGAFDNTRRFIAAEVLAKHDETYMPPEVVEALKRSGQWREGAPDGSRAP